MTTLLREWDITDIDVFRVHYIKDISNIVNPNSNNYL